MTEPDDQVRHDLPPVLRDGRLGPLYAAERELGLLPCKLLVDGAFDYAPGRGWHQKPEALYAGQVLAAAE